MEPNNYDEIKNLIEAQGKAFAEFKVANDLNIAELKKRGASDPVLEEKLARLSKGIDDALESKAALEKRIDAERKEREDLELRLSRRGDKNDRAADEVKEFNRVLAVGAAEKARPAPVFSVDEYAEYKTRSTAGSPRKTCQPTRSVDFGSSRPMKLMTGSGPEKHRTIIRKMKRLG